MRTAGQRGPAGTLWDAIPNVNPEVRKNPENHPVEVHLGSNAFVLSLARHQAFNGGTRVPRLSGA